MKKLKSSLLAKIIAFVLLIIFAFATLFNGLGCLVSFNEEFFTKTKEDVADNLYSDITYEISTMIYNSCYFDYNGNLNVSYGRNFNVTELADFVIYNSDTGEILHTSPNQIGSGYLANNSNYFSGYYNSLQTGPIIEPIEIKVMLKPLKGNSVLKLREILTFNFYDNRFLNLIYLTINISISIMLFLFLLSASGHKKGCDNITTGILEKFPFDIFTLIAGVGIFVLAMFCFGIVDTVTLYTVYSFIEPLILRLIAIILLLFVAGSVFVVWSMSLAKRIKLKSTLKSCVIYKILIFSFKKIKKFKKFNFMLFKNIKFVWKILLIFSAITFFEVLVSVMGDDTEYYVILSIIEKLFTVPIIVLLSIILKKLKDGGKKLAEGITESKIDTRYMFGEFKEHADNLNSISEGVALAVEEKMKSERLKTELITNVSHDIKTPLTSVINYVDLIKQEKPEGKKINEYLLVLERQSNRLKKLIEDLVEASKASSGNLSVNLVPCDCNILLEQAAGEYEDKFKQANLNLIIKKSEKPVVILADVRHLGRVFDNLLNNIFKHAMPGSRVYLSIEKGGEKTEICFKNISKYELNISGDELTERFVRADKSRNTEGSGLGLSIAKSLTELQKGEFRIVTDGDLFKVLLLFHS
ncbi:MAG: HAMP domain-containing histidine kinase [Ruminococcaceae bacterium]|nr:HAMP domain-containing histidine kinase [Oscillospiraceae bacterium]